MREMTTAEFAKANLAALEEPVAIRRYTKTVGIYYPEGFKPNEPPPLPPPALFDIPEPAVLEAALADKDEEIKRLKQELAKRPLTVHAGAAHSVSQVRAVGTDPFANLAKQDREFFERKLGKKK